jgi:hypothetical protein
VIAGDTIMCADRDAAAIAEAILVRPTAQQG